MQRPDTAALPLPLSLSNPNAEQDFASASWDIAETSNSQEGSALSTLAMSALQTPDSPTLNSQDEQSRAESMDEYFPLPHGAPSPGDARWSLPKRCVEVQQAAISLMKLKEEDERYAAANFLLNIRERGEELQMKSDAALVADENPDAFNCLKAHCPRWSLVIQYRKRFGGGKHAGMQHLQDHSLTCPNHPLNIADETECEPRDSDTESDWDVEERARTIFAAELSLSCPSWYPMLARSVSANTISAGRAAPATSQHTYSANNTYNEGNASSPDLNTIDGSSTRVNADTPPNGKPRKRTTNGRKRSLAVDNGINTSSNGNGHANGSFSAGSGSLSGQSQTPNRAQRKQKGKSEGKTPAKNSKVSPKQTPLDKKIRGSSGVSKSSPKTPSKPKTSVSSSAPTPSATSQMDGVVSSSPFGTTSAQRDMSNVQASEIASTGSANGNLSSNRRTDTSRRRNGNAPRNNGRPANGLESTSNPFESQTEPSTIGSIANLAMLGGHQSVQPAQSPQSSDPFLDSYVPLSTRNGAEAQSQSQGQIEKNATRNGNGQESPTPASAHDPREPSSSPDPLRQTRRGRVVKASRRYSKLN